MYVDETMNYPVIERTSNEALQALRIELQLSSVVLFIVNIVSLDYFEEGVDPYSATGKPICLLHDVNINTLSP